MESVHTQSRRGSVVKLAIDHEVECSIHSGGTTCRGRSIVPRLPDSTGVAATSPREKSVVDAAPWNRRLG